MRHVGQWIAISVWVLGLACASTPARTSSPRVEGGDAPRITAGRPEAPDAAEALADELLVSARELEVSLSPRLRVLASGVDGTLIGFEHRFKTRTSTLRKIREHLTRPSVATVDDVVIDDALRYTIQLEDRPPGHYVAGIRDTLAALERDGHQVLEVKNYWPRGDNYSGVNSVLRAPGGTFRWELQFHTPGSAREQRAGHVLYEEMRLASTPLTRKQELFRMLTLPWESVPIPEGVLTEGALHPVDRVLHRAPPTAP